MGGGLGGMSAAIRLAVDNYDVTILEKGKRLGGKLNSHCEQGFTFDTGPSILTMPWVLDHLFLNANRKLSDYITIKRIEPQWKAFFEDGTLINLTSDLPEMIKQLQSLCKEDASEFFNFLHYCNKMYDFHVKSTFKKSISGIQDLRTMLSVKDLFSMEPMKTTNQSTKKFFKNKKIQQLFNYLTMQSGSSPYQAPANLSNLAHIHLGLGSYYVEGGIFKIAEALSKILHELQVNVHLNSKVKRIVTQNSYAHAIELENGCLFEADIVVSNLEAVPTYDTLLNNQPITPEEHNGLEKYPPTVSGLLLLLGVNKTYSHLAHHNFFFSESPKKEFQQIFTEGIPATDPTIYVGISAKTDPNLAPIGKENLYVLTHVPSLKKDETWEEKKDEYRQIILNKLERMGIEGLKENIEYEYTLTPNDFQQDYGANGGSLYGVVSDRKKNGGFKIPSRSPLLKNLYFVGGSTHPGGGIPLVTLSGQLTADLILEQDLKYKKGIG
ncbi:phytoene desaturase family protein [Metabacillus litoralis]|uniref:phytoene desaturase family protein n=1 Tax=Metabacillus litoralis TaxID=152268 RepID=UPI002FC33A5E